MRKWISMIEVSVLSMAGLRLISGCIEITAAIIMLILNDTRKALAVNALLAIVGPIVLVTTMTIGLVSIADELSISKIFFVLLGVGFILFGIYK